MSGNRPIIGRTLDESTPAWPELPTAAGAPNVILAVFDDVGFGQTSAFGGLCETPTLSRLAETGLRYGNFHATALCSPTRACLLSGRNHHSVGMGALAELNMGFPGYHAMAGPDQAFLPAILRQAGYNTFAVGKWHLTPPAENSAAGPFRTWPLGRGFERYYGFMGGDTNQWYPDLVRDNSPTEPPATPQEGYHLNADLADNAIAFIRDAHMVAPDKPFLLYMAFGAGHAPHHVQPEWVEPYRGRFGGGWDAYRETVFMRQKELGLVASHTSLSRRDPDVPDWATLGDEVRSLLSRQMEVYAGFLSQTDHHLGRVIEFVDRIGRLDNTIVIVLSDNGASAEGGPEGTFNESLFFNLVPERHEDNLLHAHHWGSPETYPHYSWGWAWAGNTPFRRWKRETYRGGVAEPFIVSWPSGIGDSGGIRPQYGHAIDVLPTVLDAAGLQLPEKVDGVIQEPFHGVSLTPTFEEESVPEVHRTQYFEMHGYRALYHEGWRAVSPFPDADFATAAQQGRDFRFTELTRELLDDLDQRWELYDVGADPAETTDLAPEHPHRAREMVERWYEEAERYDVLPIASPAGRFRGSRPRVGARRDRWQLLPGAAPVSFTVAPRLCGRPHAIRATIVVPGDGAEGAIAAQGSRHGGFAFAIVDGRLLHVHNYVGLEEFVVHSPNPLGAGRHEIRYEFEPTGPPVSLLEGRGVPARSKLYVDGELAAMTELPYSTVALFGFTGLTCGYDPGDPVSPNRWSAPFSFTGEIEECVLDLSGNLTTDDVLEVRNALHRQ